jgi:hypothetical protein
MDRVPPEILQKIFLLLVLDERLACSLVCQSWWHVLDEYLLYSVEIAKDHDRFIRFIDMIQQSPHRAAQVHELELHDCISQIFNKRELCSMFPNVQHVALTTTTRQVGFIEPLEATRTKSKIKSISECPYFEYTFRMINLDLCGQLQYLKLDFSGRIDNDRKIIPQLKNMPMLEHLVIHNLDLSIADLETLHNNIPSIKRLELDILDVFESDIPQVIVPPVALVSVSLSMVGCDSLKTICAFYQYLSKKYINITKWKFSGDKWYFIHSRDINHVYENGYLQFLRLIGPTLEELNFYYVQDGRNVFKVLDESDSHIKRFHFDSCTGAILEDLAQSNQAKCVQSVSLSDTDINSIDSLECIESLTTLKLSYGSFGPIHLTKCLNACPSTLKNFSFFASDMPKLDLTILQVTCIEHLVINSPELTKELADAISFYFPKLVHLELRGIVKQNITIAPQSSYFQTAKIRTRMITNRFLISVKSLNDPSPSLCLCEESNVSFTSSHPDFQVLPTLSFEYFKKKKLDISEKYCIKISCC